MNQIAFAEAKRGSNDYILKISPSPAQFFQPMVVASVGTAAANLKVATGGPGVALVFLLLMWKLD